MLGWLLTKMTEDQREFCIKLSIELIDNTYNRRGRGRERLPHGTSTATPVRLVTVSAGTARHCVDIHSMDLQPPIRPNCFATHLRRQA
jgi:hypothetical protein